MTDGGGAPAPPRIESMRKFGSTWTVTLTCGHQTRATWDRVQKEQLMIGKRMPCQECHQGRKTK